MKNLIRILSVFALSFALSFAFGGGDVLAAGESVSFNVTGVIKGDVPRSASEKTTVLVYMIGSNLESKNGLGTADIIEMINAGTGNNVDVVLQTGGTTKWNNDVYTPGQVQRSSITASGQIRIEKDLGKICMADPAALTDFIKWGAANHKADRYILVLWDHGGGIPVGFGVDELYPNERLTDYEIRTALKNAGVHFETIMFDACLCCTLEMAIAVRDCTDYMLCAETTVSGTGMYYTGWLSTIEKNQGVTADTYCVQALQDYREAIHKKNYTGSLSVLKTQFITDVYSSYKQYLIELAANYDYSAYYKARNLCPKYNGTDSVDIKQLARNLPNKKSIALENAITNVTVHTWSDGDSLGLTAYSPFAYPQYYSQGRLSFTGLGYGEDILKFYDRFVSDELRAIGGDALNYAGSWYVQSSASGTQNSSAQSTGNTNAEDKLTAYDAGDHGEIKLTDKQLSYAMTNEIEQQLFIFSKDGKSLYSFGSMKGVTPVSDKGIIRVSRPSVWVHLNGLPACFKCTSYKNRQNSYEMEGYVYAYVNGNAAVIDLKFTPASIYPSISGYTLYDVKKDKTTGSRKNLLTTDILQAAWPVMDSNGNMSLVSAGDLCFASANIIALESYTATDKAVVVYNIEKSSAKTISSDPLDPDSF
ncbi:MAG: hypothetical protein IKQ88_07135 [Lachnospiraceae bacterium]|nr:hypothetical protein [Lachnospiraceae bacterium]